VRFVEIFNGHPYTASRGDVGKRPVTRLWDMANAERVLERGWPPLYGVAGDDVHAINGADKPTPGRGWIMVRARQLSPTELVQAMNRGDFYASTGVTLRNIDYNPNDREISVSVQADPQITYRIEVVATKTSARPRTFAAPPDRWDTPLVGVVVAKIAGTRAYYRLADDDVCVRVVVTSSRHPSNPLSSPYAGDQMQFEEAFTQPVGWQGKVR
jgi:hypothetical protein